MQRPRSVWKDTFGDKITVRAQPPFLSFHPKEHLQAATLAPVPYASETLTPLGRSPAKKASFHITFILMIACLPLLGYCDESSDH